MERSRIPILILTIIWQISIANCPVLAEKTSYEDAIEIQKSGRLDNAIAKYRELLRSKPKDHRIWYSLGSAYQAKHDLKHAADAYKTAVDLNPAGSDYKKVLSDVQDAWRFQLIQEADSKRKIANSVGKNDFSGEIKCYQEALKIKPESGLAKTIWFRLGRAYQADGKRMDARKAFEHAIYLDPMNSSFRKVLEEVGGPTAPEEIPPEQRYGDFDQSGDRQTP